MGPVVGPVIGPVVGPVVRTLGRVHGAGLGALTLRGRLVLAVGVATVVGALVLGQRDLLRVGAVLVVVPLLGLVGAWLARPTLEVARTVSPGRVPVGSTASVRVDLSSSGRRRGGEVLAEDAVPWALLARPRFVLDRLAPGARASVRYTVHAGARGRHELGPLRLHTVDPFGLVELTRSTTATDPLLVVPALTRLTPLRGPGAVAGAGAAEASADGSDDLVPREYRPGDDRRRVHWRASARLGELMVRREEQPHQPAASVLLDRRAQVHTVEGGGSTFERAVEAAASVCERLCLDACDVRLLLGEGLADARRAGPADRSVLQQRLALVQPEHPGARPAGSGDRSRGSAQGGGRSRATSRRARSTVAGSGGPGVHASAEDLAAADAASEVLGTTGEGAPDQAAPDDVLHRAARQLRGRGESVVVAVVAAGSEDVLAAVRGARRVALVVHGGPAGPGGLDAAHRTAVSLARSGWSSALLGPDDDLAATWTHASSAGTRGGTGARAGLGAAG